MKQQTTLFTISSSAIAPDTLKKLLSPTYESVMNTLINALKQQLGTVQTINLHPYRVSRVNYIKVRFEGELGQFFLTIELSGYTEFPELVEPLSRLHINLSDATDAYWFARYLQEELCTPSVDKSE
ncbi:hypothetical protein ACFGWM_03470 [Pasteurella multocida]